MRPAWPGRLASATRVGAAANAAVSGAVIGISIATAPRLLAGLAVAALIAASCEVLAPLHSGRRTRQAALTDLTHAIGNRTILLPVFAAIAPPLGVLADLVVPGPVRSGMATWPTEAQLLTLVVLSDFCNYLGHRLMHTIPVLWRLHAVHHSSSHLDWLATARGHPLDEAINVAIAALPSFALEDARYAPALVAVLYLYPYLAHANARLDLPGLGWLIVTPRFHHWHHAEEPAAVNHNFGALLSIWDRLLGTAYCPRAFPSRYGIGQPSLANGTYLTHLLAPARPRSGTAPPAAHANKVDDGVAGPDDRDVFRLVSSTSANSPGDHLARRYIEGWWRT